MKEILLSRGKVALVDDADYKWLSRWKWSTLKGSPKTFYAFRHQCKGSPKTILMHRVILGPEKGIEIDHISGDGLDNRRINLRTATRQQNQRNMPRPYSDGGSEFKCVRKRAAKWAARITIDRKGYHLGTFKTEANAATAYNIAAVQHFGEFARLNF